MPQPIQRVRLEEIDWASALPVLRLFRSFRMALHAPKLMVALLLVLLLYLGGWALDEVAGARGRVYPGELEQYSSLSPAQFDEWLTSRQYWLKERLTGELRDIVPDVHAIPLKSLPKAVLPQINAYFAQRYDALVRQKLPPAQFRRSLDDLRRERLSKIQALRALEPKGVFATGLAAELDGFQRMIRAATSLNLGLTALAGIAPMGRSSVIGAVRDMLVTIPVWLAWRHTWFLLIYGIYGLGLWALFGGALARMSALDAAGQGQGGLTGRAFAFAGRRWVWLLLAPLLPVILVGLIALVLILGGALLFNWPGLDVLGGLGFGLALLLGLMIALLVIGLAGGFGLLYPALAVEGADAIDAVSRAFNYLYRQPFRWSFYTILTLVYGAVCQLFLTVVVFLTLAATHFFVGLLVLRDTVPGLNRFEAIMPAPVLGALSYDMDSSVLSPLAKMAGVLVGIWVHLCIGLLAAFAIAFYFSAHTWIYLFLRHGSDGTALEEITGDGPAGGRELPPEPAPAPANDTGDTGANGT